MRRLLKSWSIFLTLLMCVTVLLQLFLGVNLLVLSITVTIIIIGYCLIRSKGTTNGGVMVVFLFCLDTIIIAFFIKSLLLQPIDSNLYDPIRSFGWTFIGILQLLLAFFIVDRLHIHPLFKICLDHTQLGIIGVLSFFVGATAWILSQIFYYHPTDVSTVNDPGIGGFVLFRSLFIMSIIALTASAIIKSKGKRTTSRLSIIAFLFIFAISFVDNSKLNLLQSFLAYILTVYYFKRSIISPQMILISVLIGLVVIYVSPLVIYFRSLGINRQSLQDKVILIVDNLKNQDFHSIMEQANYETGIATSNGYYDYFGGNGRFQLFAGRFASIQQIDPVIAYTNPDQPLGWEPIQIAFESVIPRVINPDKSGLNDAFVVLTSLGLVSPYGGLYPTLPLIGVSYACLGIPGVLILPFIVFFLFLLLYKLLGWDLSNNIYSVFLLCFMFTYIHEGGLQTYINKIVREIPSLFIIIYAIQKIAQMKVTRVLSRLFQNLY